MGRKIEDMTTLTLAELLDFIVVHEESTDVTKKMTLQTLGYLIMPIGSIMMWAAPSAPAGWLVCNGQAISRSTYAALFTLIGTQFGTGDGSSTFNLPDLENRVPVGLGDSSSFDELGMQGGAESVALSAANNGAHSHTGTTSTNGNHNHTGPFATNQIIQKIVNAADGAHGFSDGATTRSTSTDGNHNHSFTTSSSGSGTPHNNLQPYTVVNFIIKVV